jgi:hypothetical protein
LVSAFGVAIALTAAVAPDQAWAVICANDPNPPNNGTPYTVAASDGGVAGSTACGNAANAGGGGANSAYGSGSNAFGAGSSNISVGGGDAGGNTAANTAIGFGASAFSGGDFGNNVAIGSAAFAFGDNSRNTATGERADASGNVSSNVASGFQANASGGLGSNIAIGQQANASSTATGASRNVAMGFLANASGDSSFNVAIGNGALANGDGGSNVAIGNGAQAVGAGNTSTAIGSGTQANFTNSSAIGAAAVTTRVNQQAFGTASNTYTMAGITSGASKTAQGAPTSLVTSNASGDLAAYTFSELGLASTTDLTAINQHLSQLDRRTDENMSGVALAMAITNPDLTGSEKFGVAANWGSFEGANALGAALMGVLGNNFLVEHDRVAISGGFGVGFDNGSGDDVFGGRVGLQWTH